MNKYYTYDLKRNVSLTASLAPGYSACLTSPSIFIITGFEMSLGRRQGSLSGQELLMKVSTALEVENYAFIPKEVERKLREEEAAASESHT